MTERNARADGETGSETDRPTALSRRQLLGSTTATVVGSAALGGATESASATGFTGCDDWLDAPAEYPALDLTDANPSASTVDDLEDEFVVFVHGWLGLETSTDQAYTLREALEEHEYEEPVVAASWSADTYNYWRAESETETAGRRLAAWLESDRIDLEDATVRLVGHSLGGRVCLEALAALSEDAAVETVSLVGAAVDDDAICTDGEFAYGIATGAESVTNFHSEDDDAVCYGYDLQSLSSGLGCGGADCDGGLLSDDDGSRPENYADVDVTDAVDGHCEYTKPEVGSVPRLLEAFDAE